MPIRALNLFTYEFTIKARVVKKNFRQYSNAKGEGHLLKLELIDRDDTMIEATGFGQQALDFD